MIKVIFCAFNEEDNLKQFIPNLDKELKIINQNYEIIACLDGSSDGSLELINNFQKTIPIKALPIINSRGLGIAYKRVFLDIIKNSDDQDLIISLDADNTHNPNQFKEMVDYFNDNSLEVLVASRFCNNSTMVNFPLYRQLISKSISILLQFLFPIKRNSNGAKLQDYTSGYRIYKVKRLKELFAIYDNDFIKEPEFTYTCEFLIKLSFLKNIKIDEIALSYNYDKKIGQSKLRIFRNFYRLLILLINLQMSARKKLSS